MAAFNEDDLAAHIEDTEASDTVDDLRQQFDFMGRFGTPKNEDSYAEGDDGDEEDGTADEVGSPAPARNGGRKSVMKRMSMLERAANDETISSLLEMFPDWKRGDMEALFNSCGEQLQSTAEEVIRLSERGKTSMEASAEHVASVPNLQAASAGDNPILNLADHMSRGQLDDYERHVIDHLGDATPNQDETMSIALTVPAGAQPGGAIRVAMVDGSEYNVQIPAGVGPGQKFLAVFPVAPMRAAAAVQLGRGQEASHNLDEFLSAVDRGSSPQGGATTGGGSASNGHNNNEEEDPEMAAALAASAAEHEKAQSAARAEDEQLKNALVESAIEGEEFAE